jgi:prephenate dehydrogenase
MLQLVWGQEVQCIMRVVMAGMEKHDRILALSFHRGHCVFGSILGHVGSNCVQYHGLFTAGVF